MIEDPSQRARVLARFVRNERRLRDRAGLTQEDAAIRAGLHRTSISLLERYERMPRVGTLLRIVGALDSDPWSLLEGLAWDLAGGRPAPLASEGPGLPDGRRRRVTTNPMLRFGLLLTRERLRARLRQGDLAELVHLHNTEIALIEEGGRQPRLDLLLQLAAAVEADPADLLAGIYWAPGRATLIHGGYVPKAEQLNLRMVW